MARIESKDSEQKKLLTPEDEIKELEMILALKKEKLEKGKVYNIEEQGEKVKEKIETPEKSRHEEQIETKKEREIIPESIKEKLKFFGREKKGVPISRPPAAIAQINDDAIKIKKLEAEQQVRKLTELAVHKGIYYAIEVVQHIDDPYLIDRFHDALINDYFDKLVAAKKLKKI